ncbi:MAG: sugar ABC transporter permease [Candidatus Bipolaricaulaceae bacterium]
MKLPVPQAWKSRRFWRETLEAYVYLLPTLAVLGLFTFYPFINAFLYSAYDIGTRTVPGEPVLTVTVGVEEWASALRRGRIPEPLVAFLAERYRVDPEQLWVRLREANRWVLRDEGGKREFVVLRESEVLTVRPAVTRWDLRPVGWKNFQDVLADRDFHKALLNTTKYVIISVPVTLALALLLATLLNQAVRGRGLFRTANFLPYITPWVAVAMVFRWIYNRDIGLLNYLLSAFAGLFGQEVSVLDWLNDPKLALPALILMQVWRFTGYQALILLAGMQGIDREYYEAARVDGASALQTWWRVTVPLLTPQLFFLLIISLIGSFRIFEEVMILFMGAGPENSGLTMVYYIFRKAFESGHYGPASAASVILFAIIFALSLFQLTVVQRRVHYER